MNVKSTREAAIAALLELAEADPRIVLVSADSVMAARALPFLKRFPDRLYELGIAEQDAVAFAAGLASTGLIPFVITYAGFITMRACEQLRTFVAYPGLKVRLIGLNGGLLGGEREGVTHQFFEDIGIVRTIAGITVVAPADANQAYRLMKEIADIDGPVYLRLGSGHEPEVYPPEASARLGKLNVVRDFGRDVVIFSSGFVLNRAIDAAEALEREGIHAVLADVHTLKPLDDEAVTALLRETAAAVTVEDHSVIGGLGSAVCELACQAAPARVTRIGLQDLYPRSGNANALLDHYGISAAEIVRAAQTLVQEKRRASRHAG